MSTLTLATVQTHFWKSILRKGTSKPSGTELLKKIGYLHFYIILSDKVKHSSFYFYRLVFAY